MEMIYHGYGHINVGFKERNVRMGGECHINGFLVWINGSEWVSHRRKTLLTVEELVDLMRAACGFTWREDFHFVFLDDKSKIIFFSPQGEPYVYIEEGVVKSSKGNFNCLCEALEESDDYSEIGFRRLSWYINDYAFSGNFKKIREWKKHGEPIEGRYKCTRCGKVWRLVWPRDSFRGLWEKV